MEVKLEEVYMTDDAISVFISIQSSVANPKTYRMGYVTEKMAIHRMFFSEVLFIKVDDKIVGVIEYKIKNEKKSYIQGIAIYPEHQKKGIGKEAIKLLLSDQLKDCKEVTMNTHPDNEALRLYKSLGFVIKRRILGFLSKEPSLFLSLIKQSI